MTDGSAAGARPGRAAPVALITGASSGIGAALAREAAADGYDPWLVARRETRLRNLAAELERAHGVRTRALALDLSLPEAPEALAAALAREGRAPEVLVNNAGVGSFGPFLEEDPEDTDALLRLNIETLTRLTRRFLPAMVRRGRGRVLNVASTAAFQPGPYMATYYASKAYVLHFSEAVAYELRGSGVTVTALCPGPTRTEFHGKADMEHVGLLRWMVVMDAAAVARHGWRGAMAGRRVVVPGLINKAGVLAARLAPRALAHPVVAGLQRPAVVPEPPRE